MAVHISNTTFKRLLGYLQAQADQDHSDPIAEVLIQELVQAEIDPNYRAEVLNEERLELLRERRFAALED